MRKFQIGEIIFMLDAGLEDEPVQNQAMILSIDETEKILHVVVTENDGWINLAFEDYQHTFFGTAKEAEEAVKKLPKPNATVYRIKDKKIETQVTKCVDFIPRQNGTCELSVIFDFNTNDYSPVREIGRTMFNSRAEAEMHIGM